MRYSGTKLHETLGFRALFFAWVIVATPSLAHGQADDLFEKQVRPILANNCYPCHGPAAGEGQAGLRLDSSAGMLRGGRSGPAVVPGEPNRSLFILAVNHDTLVQMPPKKKLPRAEIAALTQWVKAGARWPDSALSRQSGPARAAPREQPGYSQAQIDHWAFQPVRDPPLPDAADSKQPRSPIDRFLRAALDAQGLTPADPADKRTLIRRATIDLHGLPPTPAQVDAFVADESSEAFAKVVIGLLASPRYGERWGRHWLDVARYADSNGMDDNIVHGDAWRYRDYVIQAFNDDKPYDQFVREQLAGDLMTDWGDDNRAESLIATGFLMLGPKMVGEDDPVKQKLDVADEQLATTARAFMGLTIDCARCHDHKFDPIPTENYYSLLGIFTSTKTVLTYRVTSKLNAVALYSASDERRLSEIEDKYDFHDDFVTNSNLATIPQEVFDEHEEAIRIAKQEYECIPKAMAVGEGEIADLPVMIRGSHLTPGAPAPRGFPAILGGREHSIAPNRSGRLELARWLSSPGHPLTARVMVNRVWKGHFGEGIVRTTDNFGLLGDRPDNPALLDWLAARFVESGWSIKTIHRLIMLSDAYRMSSQPNAAHALIDPENRRLWRMHRRRMEAEVVRDSLLAAAGNLDDRRGGRAMPHDNFVNLNGDGKSRDPALYASNRRGVYLPVLRSALYEVFETFDFANPSTIQGRRQTTTVAPQALFMMNSELMEQASRSLADRIVRENEGDVDRLRAAYRLVHLRPPDRDESKRAMDFLKRYEQAVGVAEGESAGERPSPWQALCRVLFSSNEFVYVM